MILDILEDLIAGDEDVNNFAEGRVDIVLLEGNPPLVD